MVVDPSRRSDVIQSVAVINRHGTVVASDDLPFGHQLALPDVVFEGRNEIRFVAPAMPLSAGGLYYVFVPLSLEGQMLGYLRLSLNRRRIAGLHEGAERQLLLVGLAGLAAIGLFGIVLHRQLQRRARTLARAMEDAARGSAAPSMGRDEFSVALETASRIGRELSEERSQAGEQLDAIAEVLNVGVLLVRGDRGLVRANARACELLGCASPSALAARWPELETTLSPVLERPPGGRGTDLRCDIDLPSDDHPRPLRLEAYPLGEEGEGKRLILIKDREMIDTLETNLRLATQMRAFARLYTAVAHDLKAPLNAMVLNLELLKDSLEGASEEPAEIHERRTRYARVLHEELARLNRVVRTLLSQTAQGAEKPERLDLRELLNDLQMLLAPQAMQQGVSLETSVPETAVSVDGYRDRLKQALLNISLNALEAMPDGGRMDMQLTVENGSAEVAIRDSGPGIAPQLLDKIYELHFTTKEGGSGVGMYVARSVVESHGGCIRAESQPGKGTCFRVTLPTAAER